MTKCKRESEREREWKRRKEKIYVRRNYDEMERVVIFFGFTRSEWSFLGFVQQIIGLGICWSS